MEAPGDKNKSLAGSIVTSESVLLTQTELHCSFVSNGTAYSITRWTRKLVKEKYKTVLSPDNGDIHWFRDGQWDGALQPKPMVISFGFCGDGA